VSGSLGLLSTTRRDFSFVRRYRIHSLARVWLPETPKGRGRDMAEDEGESAHAVVAVHFPPFASPCAPRAPRQRVKAIYMYESAAALYRRSARGRGREQKRASLREKSCLGRDCADASLLSPSPSLSGATLPSRPVSTVAAPRNRQVLLEFPSNR